MIPAEAAWVRNHAWTAPVRELHQRAPFVGGGIECLCQEQFTCARCAAGYVVDHDRDRLHIHAPDAVVVDTVGVVYEATHGGQEAPLAVWLADRMCTQRCSGPPSEEPSERVPALVQGGLW